MEVVVSRTPEETARRADGRPGRASAGAGRQPVLGLATGSSPLGLYQELGRAVASRRADFSAAHGVALDEYVGLPPGHPEGYRPGAPSRGLRRSRAGRRAARRPGRVRSRPAGAHGSRPAFEERVTALGGVDVQVLGIGANGHLGFNEPGSALTSRTRVKRLSERTRRDNARFFTRPEDVPTHCLTQGLGTILDARRLVLVATGDTKSDAVAAALEGPLTASVPASVLQWHPDTVVCLDEAAAAGLRNRQYYDDAASGLTG